MRMWLVDPAVLCRKHLLGEHVEMHMFAGAVAKGKSIQGFFDKGLIDPTRVQERHDALAQEIVHRGYVHKSPLAYVNTLPASQINILVSLADLQSRCAECAARIKASPSL